MKKKKPYPEMPHWVWIDRDDCWLCKNRNNCNRCKLNKNFYKSRKIHKYKGSTIGTKISYEK